MGWPKVESQLLVAVLGGLALFGLGYNRWVAKREAQGHDRGYLSLIVALGVAVTIAGYALLVASLAQALLLLACFVASGTPMIIGSIRRYVKAREAEYRAAQREAQEKLRGH